MLLLLIALKKLLRDGLEPVKPRLRTERSQRLGKLDRKDRRLASYRISKKMNDHIYFSWKVGKTMRNDSSFLWSIARNIHCAQRTLEIQAPENTDGGQVELNYARRDAALD